ncbi:MAG: TIGR03790 family protein [Verrucomicrobia bacterium]|nr:TIGR03790 family protein [Verrucomicrobiota bacterium]
MRLALGTVLLGLGGVWQATAAPAAVSSPGSEVAVVYNLNVAPDSRLVAEHYAARRGVPPEQLIGLPLPSTETITRAAFRKQLYRPLVQELEKRGLVQFEQQRVPPQDGVPGGKVRVLTASRVRYLVLAYGVPLRITPDKTLKEPGTEQLPAPLQRNEAAVDNELACLPLLERGALLTGPILNPFHGSTNVAALHPTNGLFLVSRLDGPSAAVAQRLVDRALQAETNGLWGRAFFDVRGLTNTAYVKGDEWIRTAYETARRQGFEVVLDERPATFPAWFPMPQIALYAGWYDKDVSGPLARDAVEFQPGAVAYHLHSFSAQTVREPGSRWVGPFLERGVTATLGTVAEPYLDLSPNVGIFFTFLISLGCNFAGGRVRVPTRGLVADHGDRRPVVPADGPAARRTARGTRTAEQRVAPVVASADRQPEPGQPQPGAGPHALSGDAGADRTQRVAEREARPPVSQPRAGSTKPSHNIGRPCDWPRPRIRLWRCSCSWPSC